MDLTSPTRDDTCTRLQAMVPRQEEGKDRRMVLGAAGQC